MQVTEIGPRATRIYTEQQKEDVRQKIKKMQKEGAKLVRGMFEFVDAPGGWFDFDYRFYPGEPITKIKITHGEICEVPLELARHLNNCYKKVRMLPENLDQGKSKVSKTSRTRFIPMDMLTV